MQYRLFSDKLNKKKNKNNKKTRPQNEYMAHTGLSCKQRLYISEFQLYLQILCFLSILLYTDQLFYYDYLNFYGVF